VSLFDHSGGPLKTGLLSLLTSCCQHDVMEASSVHVLVPGNSYPIQSNDAPLQQAQECRALCSCVRQDTKIYRCYESAVARHLHVTVSQRVGGP
jgi:hypothetical protein